MSKAVAHLIGGVVALALGLVVAGVALYLERQPLRLLAVGTRAPATATSVLPVGSQASSTGGRYNLGGSASGRVQVYELRYRIDLPGGPAPGATRLTYDELRDMFPEDFDQPRRAGVIGKPLAVRYLADDPTDSVLVHALPFGAFWGPLIAAATLLAIGVALLRERRKF